MISFQPVPGNARGGQKVKEEKYFSIKTFTSVVA
jgi:hypothetical protein